MDALKPTETPTEAAGDSTIAEITERIEAFLAFASEGNWMDAWESYTLSFLKSFLKETFAAQVTSGMDLFRCMLQLPPTTPLEFRLTSVTMNGNTALVTTRIPSGRVLGIRYEG